VSFFDRAEARENRTIERLPRASRAVIRRARKTLAGADSGDFRGRKRKIDRTIKEEMHNAVSSAKRLGRPDSWCVKLGPLATPRGLEMVALPFLSAPFGLSSRKAILAVVVSRFYAQRHGPPRRDRASCRAQVCRGGTLDDVNAAKRARSLEIHLRLLTETHGGCCR